MALKGLSLKICEDAGWMVIPVAELKIIILLMMIVLVIF